MNHSVNTALFSSIDHLINKNVRLVSEIIYLPYGSNWTLNSIRSINHLLSVRAILKTNRYKISHKSIARVKYCFTFPGEIAISSSDDMMDYA